MAIDEEKYINITTENEAVEMVNKFIIHQTPFTFWQTQKGPGRLSYSGSIKSFDKSTKQIIIKLKDVYSEKFFTPGATLYSHSDDMNILMRNKVRTHSADTLILTLPKRLKILEQRVAPRASLEKLNIPIRFFKRVDSQTSEISLRSDGLMLNVSDQGCLVRFLNIQMDNFHENDPIEIHQVAKEDVNIIAGKIRHVLVIDKIGTVELIQFGMQFERPIFSEKLLKLVNNYIAGKRAPKDKAS